MEPEVPRAAVLRRMPGFDVVVRIAARLTTPASGHSQLLAVGSTSYEPWHLVAHLSDASQWGGSPIPPPTLVRHVVPEGAPPHLAVDLAELRRVDRHGTVLVVAPDEVDEGTLERLADARRRGGTVLAVSTDEAATSAADITDVAHEIAVVTSAHFEAAQHVIPSAAVRGLMMPESTRRRPARLWRPLRFAS